MTSEGSVFTIAGGAGFLRGLVRGLVARHGSGPETFSGMLVLLPNRRACRALGDAFLREFGGKPLLLPEITPIGDIDDGDPGVEEEPAAADLPPAISPLRRQMLLARLVMARGDSLRPGQALRLAAGLARFLDEVQTERLEFGGLRELAPENLAAHWQEVLGFLEIVTDHWPRILDGLGCLDPVARRNRLTEARIRAWRETPPDGPVIAAGSTGTVPATADLLACVAGLERGAVVLPGFDRSLAARDRAALGPSHPQHGMARLADRLRVAEVAEWDVPDPGAARRADVVNAALRPPRAAAPEPADPAGALSGVRRIECPGLEQEAHVVAMLLREALEIPERTAALVTPERGLARRVAAQLRRWNIDIDDSGGQPLAATPAGAFLRLTAEAVASDAAPVPLLAALKHPLASGGLDPAEFRRQIRRVERAALRGRRPEPGFAGLREALEAGDAGRVEGLPELARRLEGMAAPFAALTSGDRAGVAELVEAHVGFAEALAATPDRDGAERLWEHASGEQASVLISDLHEASADFPEIPGRDWPRLLDSILEGRVFRPPFGRHPRLNIWGLLEARLQHADLVVLGGLNEGAWPPVAMPGPWMSRPMRAEFGLAPPERRIGLTAHDFVQGFTASEVVMTRSTRVDGSPTVPARWLTRLETFLASTKDGDGIAAAWRTEQERRLTWQADLDRRLPPAPGPTAPPTPPVEARPARLSVTEIETLIRDPYAIYARHVLGLRALEEVDAMPNPADRGTVVHAALERFLRELGDMTDPEALAFLIGIGREEFARLPDHPGIRNFWWPRFERAAEWIVGQERKRAGDIVRTHVEAKGEMPVALPGRSFVLTGRADRIDALAEEGYAVIDYKTGAVPAKSAVARGLAPQLPLEAAMVRAGAFEGVPPGPVSELSYWRLSGGDPAGEITSAGDDPGQLSDDALAGLHRLLGSYENPETPYRFSGDGGDGRPSDYRHLERGQELTLSGDRE